MTSKLAQMQARFQQKQLQEREEKLLKLYEDQQQRAFERVSRGSAGSNTSPTATGGGKVRQMFDERRQKAGVDRSYPLEPLKPKTAPRGPSLDRKVAAPMASTRTTAVRSTVQKSVVSIRNGKPAVQKKQVVHSLYDNNNGRESYEEQRFETDNDAFNTKSHRDMIDMMNNHSLRDSLDNEEMPKIGFDGVDNYEEPIRTRTDESTMKKTQKKNVISNGYTPVYRKENPVVSRKSNSPTTNARTPPTRSRTSVSPRTPERTVSSASSTNSTGSTAMGDKAKSSAVSRAPSGARPSAKQSPRSAVARDDLAECGYCGRRFASDRIQKHEEVCAKTGKKKRKVYDATKHRVVGTELESYVLRAGKGTKQSHMSNKSSKQTSKKDWRRTHEEFIAAIRAAKEAQAHLAKGGKLSDLPPPPPSSNPDYVQCPHCGRRFNESAAERHIPKCANFEFNKPKPGAPPKGKPIRR